MYEIKDMTKDEYEGKAYVHYHSWIETYTGLMPDEYLGKQSFERCRSIAESFPQNTMVAMQNGKVAAFACYSPCQDDDLTDCGEVQAIYILKEHQKNGLGRILMDKCFEHLQNYKNIVIWVLENNTNAIEFYRHYGFEFDGVKKNLSKNYTIPCCRMIYKKNK